MCTDVYSVLLHVSALYFSHHQVGILVHKKSKRGTISKLLLCCLDPSFGDEEKHLHNCVILHIHTRCNRQKLPICCDNGTRIPLCCWHIYSTISVRTIMSPEYSTWRFSFTILPYYSTVLIICKNFHILSSFNVNEMGSHWVLFLLYLNIVLSWPEDGRLRPKHVAKYNLIAIIASYLSICCVLTVHNILYKKEHKHRYTTVHFEFLGSGSGVEDLYFRIYGVVWDCKWLDRSCLPVHDITFQKDFTSILRVFKANR